jgi:UDP-N-acetylglucosamine 3-dehydrogenase
MIRIGIIGVGMWGVNHVRVLKELEDDYDISVSGINDIDGYRAREVSKRFGVKYLPLDTLLDNSDAVIISTPPSTHAELALTAIERNLHVFVEKPIATNIKDAQNMVRAAEDRNLNIMVGYIERYNPAVGKLKEIIRGNEIGELVFISARRIGPKGRRRRDIGVILDLATHDIDVIRYITEMEPTRVCSKYGSKFGEYEDYALIFLDFNDFSSIVETNLLTPYKLRELYVTGTEGVAKINYITQEIIIDRVEDMVIPRVSYEEPLKEELRHFIDVLEGREKPICDGAEGLKTLEIALLAMENPEIECIKR